MAVCCTVDVVDGLADAVQRGGCADRHVRHGHVVVYRAHEPDDPEVRVLGRFFCGDLACVRVVCVERGSLACGISHRDINEMEL